MTDVLLALADQQQARRLAEALREAGIVVEQLSAGRPSIQYLESALVVVADVEEEYHSDAQALSATLEADARPRILAAGPATALPVGGARNWVDSGLSLAAQAALIASTIGEVRAERSGRASIEDVRVRADRQAALQAITARMSATLVLSEALQVFVEGVRTALGLRATAAVLVQPEIEGIKVVAESPYGAGARGLLEHPLQCLERAAQSASSPPAFYCLWPNEGVASIPILVDNRSVGAVLIIAETEPEEGEGPAHERAPLDLAVSALSELVPHVGNAVRNAHLFTDVQVRSAQMSALYAVGRTISAMHELEGLLRAIVESAAVITGAKRCSLMLLDEGEAVLRIRAAKGIPEWIQNTAVARLGEGVSGYVAEMGEPLLIEDIRRDPRFDPRIESRYYGNHSLLSIPLIVQGATRGVLNMNDKESGRPFTQTDLELAVLLSSQAAVAIDNAYLYEQLRMLAATDSLTRLYNHRHFMTRLDAAIKHGRRHGRPLSILMMDLDHFKRVNDTYGHQQGDRVLQAFASILKRTAREEDTLARYGGEEFAAILPDTSLRGAMRLGERIRNRVRDLEFEHSGGSFHVTVSVGAAELSDGVRAAEDFAAFADEALYRAKEAGRDRVVARDPERGFVSDVAQGSA